MKNTANNMRYHNLFALSYKLFFSTIMLYSSLLNFTQPVLATDLCDQTEKSSEIAELCKKMTELQFKTRFYEAEKNRYEAEKEKIKAQNEAFKANLPDTGVTPLTGEIELPENEKFDYEITFIAHGALAKAAEKIAAEIQNNLNKMKTERPLSILIYELNKGDKEISNKYMSYHLFDLQYKAFEKAYKEFGLELTEDKTNTEAIGANIGASLGSFINIAKLFNVNKEYRSAQISKITVDSLATQLSKNLQSTGNNNKIYYPTKHLFDKKSINKVIEKIDSLIYLQRLGTLEEKKLEKANPNKIKIQALNTKLNDFLGKIVPKLVNLASSNDSTDEQGLIFLSKGHFIHQMFDEKSKEHNTAYILYINVIAGGSTRRTRSIFGGKLRHSGGVIVNYQLTDLNGKIIDANHVNMHSGFRRLKKNY